MKRIFILISAIIALSSCATTSHRANSKSERAQRAELLFQQLDTNHDGFITKAELAAGLRYAGTPELNPNLVMGLKNDHGKKLKASRRLTDAEIQKVMTEAFAKRDTELDHRLSKDEFKKLVVERPAGVEDPWEPFM